MLKVICPPAPWLNDESIRNLQVETHQLGNNAHKNNDDLLWDQFRQKKQIFKYKIRTAKRYFNSVISTKSQKKTLNLIHSIPPPPPPPPTDEIKYFFASTAGRTLNTSAPSVEKVNQYIEEIPTNDKDEFKLSYVTYHEVCTEVKTLRNDT